MENNFYEKLRNSVETEITTFRSSYSHKTYMEVYNDFYIIGFYEEVHEMMMTNYLEERISEEIIKWLNQFSHILAFLYNEWLSADGAFSHDWDSICDFIIQIYEEEK